MRSPGGYITVVDPDTPLLERDTTTCCHCNKQIIVKPFTAQTTYLVFDRLTWQWNEVEGASCHNCLKPVCLQCHDLGICVPFERWLAMKEGDQAARRSLTL